MPNNLYFFSYFLRGFAMPIIISPSLLSRILAGVLIAIVSVSSGFCTLSAQTPIGVSSSDSTYFRRLEYVCKVWGYVKYFHPNMRQSNSWDDMLIRTLLSVKSASTQADYNAAIEQMISSPGQVPSATPPAPNLSRERLLTVDYSWMSDSTMLSPTAITGLETIRRNFRSFQSYYISASSVSTPQAANENPYNSMSTPNEQYRLLALFRHWNLINYFFPYKDDIGRPWELALREMIPVFVNTVENSGAYTLAISRMSAQINDSHGFVSSPYFIQAWGDGVFPMEVLHIEGKTVVSALNFTPALLQSAGLSGLRIGDIITAIDGVPVDSMRKWRTPFIPASNPSALQRDLNSTILYGGVGAAPLTIQRGTETLTLPAQRVSFASRNASRVTPNLRAVWRIMDNNIGYVDMGRLQRDDVATMMRDLASTRGIVFDVRNYPNGTMYDICAYLGTPKPFVKFTAPDPYHPGTFTAPISTLVSAPFWTQNNAGSQKRYNGTTVALMNATTQSHAEFTLMSFRAMGMTLFGSQTAGADGNVVTVTMPGNIVVYYTSLGVYYPDGTPTQRIGIVPDVQVLPTLAGFQAGRDEVLERGVQAILSATLISGVSAANEERSLTISPNPAQNDASVLFTAQEPSTVKMQIVNLLGTIALTRDAVLQKGMNVLPLSTLALPIGTYICRIISLDGQTKATQTFVVMR